MWIFGYGSLMWKVDFPYEKKIVGYIKGYERRFYQHSTDHRGTPENPGRVVTLVPAKESSRVYGIAYRIHENKIETVVNHLDYREKGGYERKKIIFHPKSEEDNPFEITIYVATNNNPNYAGPADEDCIANQVISCIGPSGPNIDYVCNLAEIMRALLPDVDDEHLFKIEQKVKLLDHEKRKNKE